MMSIGRRCPISLTLVLLLGVSCSPGSESGVSSTAPTVLPERTVEPSAAGTTPVPSDTLAASVPEDVDRTEGFMVPADACPPARTNALPFGNRVVRDIEDPGDLDGPTIILTPRPALGAMWEGTLEIDVGSSGQNAATEISVDWQTVVSECADRGEGGWSAERTVSAVSVDVDPDTADADRPIDQPEPLIGITFETDYNDYGSYFAERIPLEVLSSEYPDGAWYNLYLDIDRFFGWLMPTMPSELVGVGATWEYLIDNDVGRSTRGLVYHFEVVGIEGTAYLLEFEIDGPAGLVGRGQIVGNITKPLPESAQLTGQINSTGPTSITVELSES